MKKQTEVDRREFSSFPRDWESSLFMQRRIKGKIKFEDSKKY